MAAYSQVEDDELCQVADEAEEVYSETQKQSTVLKEPPVKPSHADLIGQSSSEGLSEDNLWDVINMYRDKTDVRDDHSVLECQSTAAVCDVNTHTGCDEVICSDKYVGANVHDTENNQNIAFVCDSLLCCDGDISNGESAQNLLCGGSHTATDCKGDENLHLSKNRCLPDEGTVEPAMDCCLSNRLENVADGNDQIVDEEGQADDESDDDLFDEKQMSTSSTDSDELQTVGDVNLDNEGSGGLSANNPVEECSSKAAELASDKKPPHLSFSPDVLLVAPTGKAANVLGRRTGIQAFTLHQVIFSYYAWRRSDHSSCPWKSAWKFEMVRLLVVDEGSLVAVTVFYSLISKVLPSLQKVVLLGDILQLPSIEPGTPPPVLMFSLVFGLYFLPSVL